MVIEKFGTFMDLEMVKCQIGGILKVKEFGQSLSVNKEIQNN
jgi:hypothetical protein